VTVRTSSIPSQAAGTTAETAYQPNTPLRLTSLLCYGYYLWDAAHSREEHGESLSLSRIENGQGTEAGCDDEVSREKQQVTAGFSAFSWARPRVHTRRSSV
jgi:hypothetical protein